MRWFIWFLAVSFFFYEFVLRVSPSVMVEALMTSFHADAGKMGAAIGIYFYIYAPMQLPVGLLMDRFGPRYLLPKAAFICGVAGVLFGYAAHLDLLSLSRLLMGFGSAFAFVGVLVITSRYFPHKELALLIGIANSIAMIGAISGEGPISILENYLGWRYSMIFLGIMGILLALVMHFVMRKAAEINNMQSKTTLLNAWKSLKSVLRHPVSWINAIIAALLYTTTSAFAALWGVSFLMHNHHLSRDEAGFASSTIYLGWIFGGPIIGYISDRIDRRRPFLIICPLVAGIIFLPLILFNNMRPTDIFLILFLIGFFSAAELLNFSYAIDLHTVKGTGSAIAFTNFIIMLSGALFQPLVGILLDLFSNSSAHNGLPVYSDNAYKLAMLLFPITFFLAFILSFFLKETKISKKT